MQGKYHNSKSTEHRFITKQVINIIRMRAREKLEAIYCKSPKPLTVINQTVVLTSFLRLQSINHIKDSSYEIYQIIVQFVQGCT